MTRLFKAGFVGAAFMALAVTAVASGPEWGEVGDAGDLPGGGQATLGVGPLGSIAGNLGGAALFGDIDVVDMYLIDIFDPMNFRVTTDPLDGRLNNAFAQFDTQLWLFQPMPGAPEIALGILGNDDHFELGGQFSLLLPDATDGGAGLVAPGLYFIAITRSNHDPFSVGGNIFFQANPQEISSADAERVMI